ncbi:hypothetical protein [Thermococcus peptonophilus]|uniref:Uncharacterized protein n=1 Tax=Thermococcus peptonophilus TaxID=53952 RepID=A0A142CV15_9EURY|nr:hypothetical protein [Thermococcus peptonophilus]AMQ18617.1 hypothetical protein A0127_05270 [Thermococcus peptonophilus]
MEKVVIEVEVPKEYAEEFRREVEEMAKYLRNRKALWGEMKKLKGILKTDKSWEELKEECYEAHVGRHLRSG